ncbi:MAG TPA: 2-oxoglutarate dehydrogenase, E2 component, dihydrolipoamide succinyltransferase [Propionibacteriaceae bacterium]|nr:2-oxoglutarate dehydrogenase, E2 component, dihydrolipoamide succinyltransferase [Propionibacteriaceae bacterium]
MPTSVTLPALGESVTEGTVTRWLKQVGDNVEADEPLLEVSTDKVDTEIPSPAAGVLLEITAQEDETVEVGAVLAVIGDAREAAGGGDGSAGAPAVEEQAATQPQVAQDIGVSGDAASAPTSAAEEQTAAEAAPETAPSSGGAGPAGGTEVTLPALGESVTEGTVTRWLKQVGDQVTADEALLEVSTDKVDTEIPSPASGVLLDIRVQEDETVEVGSVLAVVGEPGAAAQPEAEPQPEPEREPQPEPEPEPEAQLQPEPEAQPEPAAAPSGPPPEPEAQRPVATAPPPGASGTTAVSAATEADAGYVTPLVRKLAKEHDIDLGQVNGTGVGGRIRKQDVLAAAEAAKSAAAEAAKAAAAPPAAEAPAAARPAPAAAAAAPEVSSLRGTTEKMSRLRQTIARRMVESLQVAAQLTATVEVDLTAISRIRAKAKEDFKKREGASLSYLPFITKAAIEALKIYPKVNATIDTEAQTITYPDAEHVGIAVDTEKGLLVPVIRDAGDLNIAGLAKKIGDLAARTRQNKVSPDELSGGTFTITNYGSAGTLMDTPIINQPQVAILGTGALVKRPVVVADPQLGEVIAVRDMMYLSMSYDHRLVDGAEAARFLSTVKARLEEGDFGSEFGL